jgi:hypothetical protein
MCFLERSFGHPLMPWLSCFDIDPTLRWVSNGSPLIFRWWLHCSLTFYFWLSLQGFHGSTAWSESFQPFEAQRRQIHIKCHFTFIFLSLCSGLLALQHVQDTNKICIVATFLVSVTFQIRSIPRMPEILVARVGLPNELRSLNAWAGWRTCSYVSTASNLEQRTAGITQIYSF